MLDCWVQFVAMSASFFLGIALMQVSSVTSCDIPSCASLQPPPFFCRMPRNLTMGNPKIAMWGVGGAGARAPLEGGAGKMGFCAGPLVLC